MSPQGKWWQRALGTIGVRAHTREDLRPDFDAEAARAGRYVFLFDDDVSPMAKVAEWLRESFDLTPETAARSMLTAHQHGFAALGPYEPEEAERRLAAAHRHAERLGLGALRFSREPPAQHGLRPPP